MRNFLASSRGAVSLTLGVLFLLFILVKIFPFRIDLTEEKRYSLHPATKKILAKVDVPLEVDILLTGKLPGGMRRFQKNIEETVQTFNAYSRHTIKVRYFNPLEIENKQEQEDYIYYLSEFGINPTQLMSSENGGQTSRLVFPGVIVRDQSHEIGSLLLKGEKGMSPDEILNVSIENLEYEIISLIRKLTREKKQAVAMVTNHGELQEDEGYGVVEALSGDYELYKVPLGQAKRVEDLLGFAALIVAGPRDAFSEREVYLIDQYLMRGGKLLFFIDPLAVDLDQVDGPGTIAMPFDTGLDQLLFRYGIRINQDMVQDMNFGYHPVVAGEFGNQPQVTTKPWPFYVVANRMSNHPITKGLDQLKFRYVSTLDTVKAEGVKKRPLVFSGRYSRVLNAPVKIALEEMSMEPQLELFNRQHIPLAYLLEGKFTSFFKNRFLPEEFKNDQGFQTSGEQGAVLVVGDGDWVQNSPDVITGDPLPLGVDQFSDAIYANREFLQNAVKYLTEPNGIMASRNKTFKLRPLDKVKLKSQKLTWQLVNILVPLAVVLLAGMVKIYGRRWKYGGKGKG